MSTRSVKRNGLVSHLVSRASSEGATTLNDMKDMLASLPQYQEMREKVRYSCGLAELGMHYL